MHDHILSSFDHALARLRESVLTMCSLARKNLSSAMRGLLERDTDLCNEAIAADQEVNELEKAVDKLGMQILLKFQPSARDLRQVMANIRIANNLERISDQASGIGKRARVVNQMPEMSETRLLQPLYHLTLRNFEASIQAFAESDAELATKTRKLDKELDSAEKTLNETLIRVMEDRGASLEGYLHLIFVARFLERVGDHSKNICEDTIFIESAEDVRFAKDKRAEVLTLPL